MIYDVAIIGAGMSGLAAGIRLAYFGKKVCILEKHSRIGGLNSYYERSGFKFDVGLHALTNYVDKKERSKPLMRLLRQLRINYDDLDLRPQKRSAIKFEGKELYFSNDSALLESEIADKFPSQITGFKKLLDHINSYNELDLESNKALSSREVLKEFISDELLTDMLLCPLMFYGNSKEDDMDYWMFVVMFKSIFSEGLARPYEGVRVILNILKKKFEESGGELLLKKEVSKIAPEENGDIAIELKDGNVIKSKKAVSSAGYLETMKLTDDSYKRADVHEGKMSFMESIFMLDRSPADLGIDETIIFYNNDRKFEYKSPDKLVEVKSGVICCPNNFAYDTPLENNSIRVTNISNSSLWDKDDKSAYKEQKKECLELTLNELRKVLPDFKESVIYTDSFTPHTIERYTGHINGAVYGSQEKVRDGRTSIENLYICGTDQGFLGITGAMLSGITIANLYLLK